MNTSQLQATPDADTSVLLRVLVVAGALVGFAVLSLLMSGAANAESRAPSPAGPDRPGVLGQVVHDVAGQAESVLQAAHQASAAAAPLVQQVTEPVSPLLEPVVRPLSTVAAPLLSTLAPVTHAVGADPVITAVAGGSVPSLPVSSPRPRDDSGDQAPVMAVEQASRSVPRVEPAVPGARFDAVPLRRQSRGHSPDPGAITAGVMSGFGGGGVPPSTPSTAMLGGAVSAGSSGQHGGESAVTASGAVVPGSGSTWLAAPSGRWSLRWLVFYGNAHPS